jgi:hypothetical protein
MNSYELEYKDMLEHHRADINRFKDRKAIWEAAYDMSREWKGTVYGSYGNYWIDFHPKEVGIERFKELMYKYFHHNPRLELEAPTGLDELSGRISISVRDIETKASLQIDLLKTGLISCKVLTETEMKASSTYKYICEGGDYK